MRWLMLCGILLIASPVWAHPGELDACGGHLVTERVAYPLNPDGQPSYPSEPGEYHFHFTRWQFDEAKESLAEYRFHHASQTALGIDYGSFRAGGITYDILEKTRQDEAIVRCQESDGTEHIGIVRARE